MLELRLLILFSAAWVAVFLIYAGWLPAAGHLDLNLYRFYSIAAILGWAAGNIYQLRRRSRRAGHWPSHLLVYLIGPPSLLLIMRSLAPAAGQEAAPFVPFYALAMYGLFFLVPITLAVTRAPKHQP